MFEIKTNMFGGYLITIIKVYIYTHIGRVWNLIDKWYIDYM